MIFLRRAKKYTIDRLDNDIFYKLSTVSIINKVFYGGLIDTYGNFEHYSNVTGHDYRKYWLTHDSGIIHDEKYSKKSFIISTNDLGEIIKYDICLPIKWLRGRYYNVGFYYYFNKTLYGFYISALIPGKSNIIYFIIIKIIQ